MQLPTRLTLVALLVGCQPLHGPGDTGDVEDTDPGDGPLDDGPLGWIGSPCTSDQDCDYDGGVCLADDEGYARGMCSVACDRVCPDEDGHPVTFCVPDHELPPDAPLLGDGACHSRCDFGFYPNTGCRPDYGCAVVERANEPETLNYACLPHRDSETGSCHAELAAAGVRFEPAVVADAHPDGHPQLTCHVEDPVRIRPPLHGVDLVTSSGAPSSSVLAGCEMAHALSDTVRDVAERDVVQVRHMGTYSCRVIAGTSTLSQHAHANAIDIWGVDFADGTTYSLVDDWEHGTSQPVGPGGAFLYDAAYRWFDEGFWNIILTPNYNVAHDDHFHVDLTPGGDLIWSSTPRYVGPAPYAD